MTVSRVSTPRAHASPRTAIPSGRPENLSTLSTNLHSTMNSTVTHHREKKIHQKVVAPVGSYCCPRLTQITDCSRLVLDCQILSSVDGQFANRLSGNPHLVENVGIECVVDLVLPYTY